MKLLRLLRAINGLTQADLAEKMSVTQGAISGWETGKFEPSISDIRALSVYLGCSISDLMAETESELCEETRAKYTKALQIVENSLMGEVAP